MLTTILVNWPWEAMLRLIVASALGALIGAERERHGRSAGFRTQLLVSLGSALAMLVSIEFERIYGGASADLAVRVDPARVAYGVMGGIGFLGAGAIIRSGASIRGMTTAASLWCTAAVGLACGLGMYAIATVSALITLFALLVLTMVDRRIMAKWGKTIVVTLPMDSRQNIQLVRQALLDCGAKIDGLDYAADVREGVERITVHVVMPAHKGMDDLLSLRDRLTGVINISIS